MESKEILRIALDSAGFQVTKLFGDVPETLQDARLNPGLMSPRDTMAHLAECYTALLAMAKGDKHEWGTYKPPTTEWAGLMAEMHRLRNEVCVVALEGSDETQKQAVDFILLHDAYHVGQICALRIATQPGWDPYSIYNF